MKMARSINYTLLLWIIIFTIWAELYLLTNASPFIDFRLDENRSAPDSFAGDFESPVDLDWDHEPGKFLCTHFFVCSTPSHRHCWGNSPKTVAPLAGGLSNHAVRKVLQLWGVCATGLSLKGCFRPRFFVVGLDARFLDVHIRASTALIRGNDGCIWLLHGLFNHLRKYRFYELLSDLEIP